MAAQHRPKEERFQAFVLANRRKLPITVQATEGLYNSEHEISSGDIMRILHVEDQVSATFNHPDTRESPGGESVTADLPSCYTGGFETVLRHGPHHVYRLFSDVARDFPQSVRILEDVEIQGMLVRRGEGLKLDHIQQSEEGSCVYCTHVPSQIPLSVPYRTRGRFSPRQDDKIYALEELFHRMPVLVKRENNLGRHIRLGVDSQSIPGVPDDFFGTMLLTKKTMVTIDHWDDPGRLGIYDVTTKRKMHLPIDFDITVIPAAGIVAQYDASEDLFDAARGCLTQGKPLFALLSSGQRGLDYLNLVRDVVLIIHKVERKKGFLVNGRSLRFLVPNDYKKSTHFKILGKEYITPYDLWKAKHLGPVKATVTQRAPPGFPEARSIYKNDEVRLSNKPGQLDDLSKLAGSGEDAEEEMDIVHLERLFSTQSQVLGAIYVPSYITVHFKEATPSLGEHSIGNVTAYGNLPMTVELASITSGASMTKDDNDLLSDSPLHIVAECQYSVAYVTLFDPRNVSTEIPEAKEIPDFLGIQVRPIREKFPVKGETVHFKKPTSNVYHLTLKQYSNLYDPEIDEENNYEKIEEPSPICDPPLPPRPDVPVSPGPRMPPVMPTYESPMSPDDGQSHRGERPSVRRNPSYRGAPLDPGHNQLPTLPKPTNTPRNETALDQRPVVGVGRNSRRNSPTPAPKPAKQQHFQAPHLNQSQGRTDFQRLRPQSEVRISGLGKEFDDSTLKRKGLSRPERSKYSTIAEDANFAEPEGQYDEPYVFAHDEPQRKTYDKPYVVASDPDQELIPKHPPPSDGNISEFDILQLAGMFHQLNFGKVTVQRCIQKQITGIMLIEMSQSMPDGQLKQELGMTNDSHFYALKHFINQSQYATSVPKVTPPADGKIHNFNVREIAGLLRHLEFNDQSVSNCLLKQIDGKKLCDMGSKMSDGELKRELKIDNASVQDFFAMKYFILSSISELNNNN